MPCKQPNMVGVSQYLTEDSRGLVVREIDWLLEDWQVKFKSQQTMTEVHSSKEPKP